MCREVVFGDKPEVAGAVYGVPHSEAAVRGGHSLQEDWRERFAQWRCGDDGGGWYVIGEEGGRGNVRGKEGVRGWLRLGRRGRVRM